MYVCKHNKNRKIKEKKKHFVDLDLSIIIKKTYM